LVEIDGNVGILGINGISIIGGFDGISKNDEFG